MQQTVSEDRIKSNQAITKKRPNEAPNNLSAWWLLPALTGSCLWPNVISISYKQEAKHFLDAIGTSAHAGGPLCAAFFPPLDGIFRNALPH